MVGQVRNMPGEMIEKVSYREHPYLSALFIFLIIFAISSAAVFYYYQAEVHNYKSQLKQITEIKSESLNTLLINSNLLSTEEYNQAILDWVRVKKYFYGLGKIDISYIKQRPGNMAYVFHHEDSDRNPVNEIKYTHEMDALSVAALENKQGTFTGKDYSGESVFAYHMDLSEADWSVIAKIDTKKIQQPFIFKLLALFIIIFICFFLAYIAIKKINKINQQNITNVNRYSNKLINSSSNVIYTLDCNTYKTLYISDTVKQLLGFSAEEVMSSDDFWINNLHPDDLDTVMRRMKKLTPEKKIDFEYRLKNNEGHYTWIQDSVRINKDAEGNSIEFIGCWSDISYLKKTEQALIEQKDYVNNLLQNLSTATFIIDTNHSVLYWNKACEKLTGLPAAKVLGTDQHWRGFYRRQRPCLADVLIDKLDADPFYIRSDEYDDGTGRLHGENWCTVYGGQRLYLTMDVAPIYDKNGKLVAVIENLLDLTTHRTLETELIDSNNKALAAVKAKDQFLANMSHEIRTPMNGVLGMLELIKQTPLSEEQKDLSNTAYSCAESLLDIINEILDFSKLDSDNLKLENIEFDLYQLLSDIGYLFKYKTKDKDVSFELDKVDDFPQHLKGDPTRLRQILINLLGNAVKFTEEGEIRLVARLIKQERKTLQLCFDIIDTGIGIPIDKQKNLFDEFTQVDASTTRKYGGTGLGLSITKKLVELMDGTITLNSKFGEGSHFMVIVPLEFNEHKKSEEKDNVVPLPLRENNDLSLFCDIKMLLVEDNKVNQKVALGLLKKLGLKADVVENGKQAVASIIQGDYQLVLMDCQMPVMDGYQATKAIRQYEQENNKQRIAIIAMTANAMQGDREKCLGAGMDDYITKPIDKGLLHEKLYAWMSKSYKYDSEVHLMNNENNELTSDLLDEDALQGLQSIMEDEFVEIIQLYLEESLTLMSDVHAGFSDEAEKLLRAVHTLKSSSKNVGAIRVGAISEKMEALVKDEAVDTARQHLNELEQVFTETHLALKKYLEETSQQAAV